MLQKNILFIIVTLIFAPALASAASDDLSGFSVQLQSLSRNVQQIQQRINTINNNYTLSTREVTQEPIRQQTQAVPQQIRTRSCVTLTSNMSLGTRDSWVGGDVTKLQDFLTRTGDYTFGRTTGFFGPVTQSAVQKWQALNGVVSSGQSWITGYGVVGPKTRGKMQCGSNTDNPQEYEPILGVDLDDNVTICAIPNYCDNGRGFPEGMPQECKVGKTTTAGKYNKWFDTWQKQPVRDFGKPRFVRRGSCVESNQPPTINSFLGPTTLKVNQTGTWRINVSDQENSSLSYNVNWGDSQQRGAFVFKQNTTFTHSYKYAGTYTISITVHDSQGLTAKTTTTVKVGSAILDLDTAFSATPISGSAPLLVKFTFPKSRWCNTSKPVDVGTRMIKFGDGNEVRTIRCGDTFVDNLYKYSGVYTAKYGIVGAFAIGDDGRKGSFKTLFTQTVRVVEKSQSIPSLSLNGPQTLKVGELRTWSARFLGNFDGYTFSKVDFGDGIVQNVSDFRGNSWSFNKKYTSPGTYTIKVWAQTNGNRKPTISKTIIVRVGGGPEPLPSTQPYITITAPIQYSRLYKDKTFRIQWDTEGLTSRDRVNVAILDAGIEYRLATNVWPLSGGANVRINSNDKLGKFIRDEATIKVWTIGIKGGNYSSAQASVRVDVAENGKLPIIGTIKSDISATPSSVNSGEQIKVSWNIQNAPDGAQIEIRHKGLVSSEGNEYPLVGRKIISNKFYGYVDISKPKDTFPSTGYFYWRPYYTASGPIVVRVFDKSGNKLSEVSAPLRVGVSSLNVTTENQMASALEAMKSLLESMLGSIK